MSIIRNRTQFMNPTNAYWAQPQFKQTFAKPISGNLGFLMNLPYPDPVSTGLYEGQGSENVFGKRELVYTTLPEMYTVGGNIMPFTGGIPRVDPNSFQARINRESHTVRI